jgi:Reverse transcriptase (RNA-dependent DNA polymerase)
MSTLPLDLLLWHHRLAHHDYNSVKHMITHQLVTGIDIKSKQPPNPIFQPCLSGKMNANPFPSSTTHATEPLETDLHGPFKTRTMSGYLYWITFINDCTSFWAVMFLKAKSKAFEAFKQYKAYAENHLGTKILCMRIDKGGEYMSTAFINYMLEHGITRQYTVRAHPQQNCIAEQVNWTIQKHVVAMLNESGLPASFLGQAVAAYVHIWNCCSTTRLTADTMPYELWHHEKPDISHLRVWGCTAYVHIQKDKQTGIGSHMEKCIFVGYPQGYKGWTFYNPTTKQTIISEQAELDEQYFPGFKQTSLTPEPFEPLPAIAFEPVLDSGGNSNADNAPANPIQPECSPSPEIPPNTPSNAQITLQHSSVPKRQPTLKSNAPVTPIRSPSPELPPIHPVNVPAPNLLPDHPLSPPLNPTLTTSVSHSSPSPDLDPSLDLPIVLWHERQQVRAPGDWWILPCEPTPAIPSESEHSEHENDEDEQSSSANNEESEENDEDCDEFAGAAHDLDPKSLRQALARFNTDKWQEAAKLEMDSHSLNGTWELVNLPPGAKTIGSGWVFWLKRNADGSIEQYKAHLITKSYSQHPGFDYTEVFAPTFCYAAICTVIALAAVNNLHLRSVDISHAFLNGDLEETIYMHQAEGFHKGSSN